MNPRCFCVHTSDNSAVKNHYALTLKPMCNWCVDTCGSKPEVPGEFRGFIQNGIAEKLSLYS